MKMKKSILILTLSYFLVGCGGDSSEKTETTKANEETKEGSAPVDLCRCLTEPGNTEWSAENKDACRDVISKELGVENWEKVNFSQNPELSKKFDELAERCTGTKEVKTGIDEIDNNSSLVKEIGTSSGYVWESINEDAQIYTTLAFDGLAFRTAAYSMNGQTNSENFTKVIELSGKWKATSETSVEGIMNQNDVRVSWDFSDDYSSLTNNKGVVFERVKAR
jgi:hypothetical protein